MSVLYETSRPSDVLGLINVVVAEQVVAVPAAACGVCSLILSDTPRCPGGCARRLSADAADEFAGLLQAVVAERALEEPLALAHVPLPLPTTAACGRHQAESLVAYVTDDSGKRHPPLVLDFEAVVDYAAAIGVPGVAGRRLASSPEARDCLSWTLARFVASRVSVARDGTVGVGDLPEVRCGCCCGSDGPLAAAAGGDDRETDDE